LKFNLSQLKRQRQEDLLELKLKNRLQLSMPSELMTKKKRGSPLRKLLQTDYLEVKLPKLLSIWLLRISKEL